MTAAVNAEPEVESPCVSICVLNEAHVCLGCGRSRDEITLWGRATADQQRAINELARIRMEALV